MKFQSKEEFVEWFQKKTMNFAVSVIQFCKKMPNDNSTRVVTYQLIKSSTLLAANYRAACRARSRAEFFSKISIVVEEADESKFWLELIEKSELGDKEKLKSLLDEASQILSISAKSRKTASENSFRDSGKLREPSVIYQTAGRSLEWEKEKGDLL